MSKMAELAWEQEQERLEWAGKERDFEISQQEEEQLTLEKRQAEADEEKNDMNEDYAMGIGEII